MKFQIEKQVLGVLNKIVSKNVKNEKSGPPYCPVIFHQPKRPEKRKKVVAKIEVYNTIQNFSVGHFIRNGGLFMKKGKILKFVAIMLICSVFVGNAANAAGYKGFKYIFNYAPGAPSSANHVSQTVEVQGNANANAYAKCTSYSYTGNKPVLTVTSVSSKYPTNSTSFTGTTSSGQKMKYTEAIPPTNKTVTFKGSVSNYTSFTIVAEVKG